MPGAFNTVEQFYASRAEIDRDLGFAAEGARNDQERQFVKDLQERVVKYGARAFMTYKQRNWMLKLVARVRIDDAVKRTFGSTPDQDRG